MVGQRRRHDRLVERRHQHDEHQRAEDGSDALRAGRRRRGRHHAGTPSIATGCVPVIARARTSDRRRPVIRDHGRRAASTGHHPGRVMPWPHVGRGLPLDDVVDLDDLGRAGEFDAAFGEYRHQPLTERLELLLRVPDLADAEAAAGAERDVIVEAVGRELPGCLDRGNSSSYWSADRPGAPVKRTRMLMPFLRG